LIVAMVNIVLLLPAKRFPQVILPMTFPLSALIFLPVLIKQFYVLLGLYKMLSRPI
jgi:hypothetical protein